MVDHVANLFRNGKQDGLIFVGNNTNEEVLNQLALLYQRYEVNRMERPIFRSNCPIFMPLDFSNKVELRLDTNLIFYQNEGLAYTVVDIFAVNGGSPIVLDLGLWKESKGLQLAKSINRWDRRTDLMGMIFVISDMELPDSGIHLGILHFLDRLNLTIEISKRAFCTFDMDNMADACHNELRPHERFFDHPLIHTKIPTGRHRDVQ